MNEEMTGVKDSREFNFVMVNKSLVDEMPDSNGITKPSEIEVFCAIARFANNDSRQAFPSIKQIASKARVGERSARSAIKKLEECGYLAVIPQFKDNAQLVNLYTLLSR